MRRGSGRRRLNERLGLQRILTAVLLAALMVPAAAQDAAAPDAGNAAGFLGQDKDNIVVLAHTDPNVRRATALVNGDVLTDTDVDQRLMLVVAANGGKVPEDERERLRGQVLRNLIDEKLQIQEAKTKEITVTEADVDETFNRVAKNFKLQPDKFDAYLRERGASRATLRQQIRAELAWSRLLRRRVEPFVNVGDDEVQQVIARLEAAKGKEEYHVAEIFLAAPAGADASQMAVADNIVKQVRSGASFVAYARQFSESATASVGGDMGWVRAEQLPEAVAPVVATLTAGKISDPVHVPGGIEVMALVDKRRVLVADAGDATLSLKQLTIEFKGTASEAEGAAAVAKLMTARKALTGCGKADAVAKDVGATVTANDQMHLKQLPAALRDVVAKLQVGETTPPFGSRSEGVRMLVLCGRDETAAPKPPSFDVVYQEMNDKRVALASQRYLRDLRRDAIVDYR